MTLELNESRVLFYERALLLDPLKELEDISEQQVNEVVTAIQDPSLAKYFFHDLQNPSWVTPLLHYGIFSNPPSDVEIDGNTYYYQWPASQYLVRVAALAPIETVKIIRTTRTKNPFIIGDFVRAVLKLPAKYAAIVVPMFEKWFADLKHGDNLAIDAIHLLERLADEEEIEAALELLSILTIPTKTPDHPFHEATSRYNSVWLNDLIQVLLTHLMPKQPYDVLQILRSQLETANKQMGGHSYWRKAIETHEQNWDSDSYLTLLISNIRHLMENLVEADSERIQKVVLSDLYHELPIFQRLAIHMVRVSFEKMSDVIPHMFVDDWLFQYGEWFHELFIFLRQRYPDLRREDKDRVLAWILKNQLSDDGGEVDQDLKQHWKRRWLTAIKDYIPSIIVEQHGIIEFDPDDPMDQAGDNGAFLSWSSGVRTIEPRSPATRADLAAMTNEQLIDLLINFEGDVDRWSENPSKGGLASELEALVSTNPNRFIEILPKFVELDYLYSASLINGMRNFWKSGNDLDWQPVLELAYQFSTKDILAANYGHLGRAILDLIHEGVQNDDRAISPELHSLVKRILFNILEQGDSNWTVKEPDDVIAASLNTLHGNATEVLFSYALHYARITFPKPREGESYPAISRLEDDVKAKLATLLEDNDRVSSGVRVWYGALLSQLMFLDKKWTTENIEKIFPVLSKRQHLWQAAWYGYLFHSRYLYPDYHTLLYRSYDKAVDELNVEASQKRFDLVKKLGQHLAIFYLRGEEELDNKTGLLSRFIAKVSDEEMGEISSYLASELNSSVGEDDARTLWPRLWEYWNHRFDIIRKSKHPELCRSEIQNFSRWLPYLPEELDATFADVALMSKQVEVWWGSDEILDYLNRNFEKHELLVARILEILATHLQIQVHTRIERFSELLLMILSSKNADVRELALNIINYFGQLGIYNFKNLYLEATRN